jgi:hypothetical protein
MARGWESKAVESQIESAEERSARAQKPLRSPEDIARERQVESLQLSRARVLADIDSATNAGYRTMLERSLAFLDAKLAELERR